MHGAKKRGARDQARPTMGVRADAQKHQSRRQAPAFWELVGLTLDGRRAHSRHTWWRQWCVCPSQAAPLTPGGAQGGWQASSAGLNPTHPTHHQGVPCTPSRPPVRKKHLVHPMPRTHAPHACPHSKPQTPACPLSRRVRLLHPLDQRVHRAAVGGWCPPSPRPRASSPGRSPPN